MNNPSASRPNKSEYAEYYEKYVSLVPESDLVKALALQIEDTVHYLRALPESAGDKRYAPGKWSVKEVIGHMNDMERLFLSRALHFARQTPGPLPGIEQDDWMKATDFAGRSMSDLIDEFAAIRQSTIYFFNHLDDKAWMSKGIASGKEISVRALAFITLGHERHHLDILKNRYF